jgi:hypothetical protein
MSYLEERLSPIGDVHKLSRFVVPDYNTGKNVERTLFSTDNADNLLIHYHGLHGSPLEIRPNGQKYTTPFVRKRFKTPLNGAKYLSPKGCGMLPYLPSSLILKYRSKEHIPALILVEGELKATALSAQGVDVIGLGSIHGFYGEKNVDRPYLKEFDESILEIIKVCKVESIIYLTDADTLSINYAPDKELSTRPNSFCSAVINFRNIVKRLINQDYFKLKNYYFAHIKNEFNPSSKGIDDLLQNNPKEKQKITTDLLKLDKATEYFSICDLEKTQETDLKKYFGLLSVKNFYDTYKGFIGTKEFDFWKVKYYYDGEDIIVLKNKNYDDYLRVGANYFKTFSKPKMVEGLLVNSQVIVPWLKGEIATDFGRKSFNHIKKYNDFINVPNWIDYQSEIDHCYNVCRPLPYIPNSNPIPNSIQLLNHIANDNEFISIANDEVIENSSLGNTGTMLLDYLSIMLKHPTHLLPAPCLLSKEQETGKTTFAQLIYYMFEGNATIIQTKDFSSDFNSHWAGKFFICIDEGHFEDKRAVKESLKQIITSDTVTLNTKGVAQKEIQSYSKIMICSNDETDFISLDRTDTRFWLIKVPSLKGKNDPDFKKRLFKEIPALAHFLINREIFHPKESRIWFSTKYIENEIFKDFISTSKAHWKLEIDEAVQYVFDKINDTKTELIIQPKDVLDIAVNRNYGTKLTSTLIKKYLENDLGLKKDNEGKPRKYKTYCLIGDSEPLDLRTKTGRTFTLKREMFDK